MANKTVFISFPNACPRSLVDAALFVEYFKANGWKISNSFKDTDLILFGTCGFDTFAEEQSIQYLSIANRKKGIDTQLIAFGCLPDINGARLLKEFDVVTITPRTYERLDEIINATVKLYQVKEPNVLNNYRLGLKESLNILDRLFRKSQLARKHFNLYWARMCLGNGLKPLYTRYQSVFDIRIAKGCMGECSYCAIKFSYPSLCSKPIDSVLMEFYAGLKEGDKVFRLIAGDVGSYGQDIGTNICELLRNLFKKEEDFKLIWDDFNPGWLVRYFPELFDIITKNSRRIGYVGFPIQSGSEKIIQSMKRDYLVEDVKKCILALKKASPELDITTHVLIGFPGEEDIDFAETIRFVKEVNFQHIEVYRYSDRPNTSSTQLPNKIPEKVKNKRLWRFHREFNSVSKMTG